MSLAINFRPSEDAMIPRETFEDPAEVMSTLKSIEDTLSGLLNSTEAEMQRRAAYSGTEINSFSEGYSNAFSSALVRLEHLLNVFTATKKLDKRFVVDVLDATRDSLYGSISMSVQKGLVLIQMPILPPRSSNHNMLFDALATKLNRAASFPRWKQWSIHFCHVYPQNISWDVREIDNYQYKRVIDLVAHSMRCGDCAESVESSQRIMFSNDIISGTYIEVRPKRQDGDRLPLIPMFSSSKD